MRLHERINVLFQITCMAYRWRRYRSWKEARSMTLLIWRLTGHPEIAWEIVKARDGADSARLWWDLPAKEEAVA